MSGSTSSESTSSDCSSGKRIVHFYNTWHLGDNLLNLKFLYNISSYILQNNIHIYYYYDTGYKYNTLTELHTYVDPRTLTLKPCSEKPDGSIELWQGNSINGIIHYQFDKIYHLLYTQILRHLNIVNPYINTSIWQDEPYLLDIYNKLDPRYKNLDILIINNCGNSHQYHNNTPVNMLARYLHTKFNIVVTTPIADDIPCTAKDSLTVKEYGAISTHCKYIVSVFTGTNTCLFNTITKNTIKKWFFIEDGFPHVIENINCTFTNNMNTIKTYFDSIVC